VFTARAIESIAGSLEADERVVAVVSQARRRPYLGAASPMGAAILSYDCSLVATDRRLLTLRLTFLRGRPGRLLAAVPLGDGCRGASSSANKVWRKLDLTLDGELHRFRVHKNRSYQISPFLAALNA
jgi:hypothetical protein